MENPVPGMNLTSQENSADIPCFLSYLPELLDEQLSCGCPMQVAVMDRSEGPAHVLIDLLSHLHAEQLAYFVVEPDEAVIDRLDDYEVLFLGLEHYAIGCDMLLTQIRARHPSLPIVAVVRDLTQIDPSAYQMFQLDMIVELPRRSAALKTLVRTLTNRYLHCQR